MGNVSCRCRHCQLGTMQQQLGGLDDDGCSGGVGTCLTLGHQKNEFQIFNFSLSLSLRRLSFRRSVRPSCHHGHQRRRIHISSLVHTRRNQKLTDFSSPSTLLRVLPQGLLAAWSSCDYLQCNAGFTQKAFIIPPSLRFWTLSPLFLFSSILPPSLHTPCSTPIVLSRKTFLLNPSPLVDGSFSKNR